MKKLLHAITDSESWLGNVFLLALFIGSLVGAVISILMFEARP